MLLTFLLSSTGTAWGQESVDDLKQQVVRMKKELDLIRRERDLFKKELEQLRPTFTKKEANEKGPEGEIIGIVWEIDVLRSDGSVFVTKRFLASEGKIYADSREVGSYTETGNRVRIDITNSPVERANGVYELLRISSRPPTYAGRLRNKQGENPKIQLRIIKD